MRRLPAVVAAVLTAVLATLLSSPTAQAADWPVVGSGSTGPNVTAVQHLLTAQGYSTAADGVFGSGTTAEVKSFQSDQGLTADGYVGSDTWPELVVTVSSGHTGSAVKAAQVLLNKYGYDLAVDGDFGPGTDSATRDFQSDQGLAVDGIVGPNTWRALTSGSGSGGTDEKLTHAQAAAMFQSAGISWSSSGNCSDRYNSSCTSFDQLRRTSADGIIALKRASGCTVHITGGTETGHASGTYSHWNGYKIDFAPYSCVSNYVTGTFTYLGKRSDGAALYESGSGNVYAHEGSHWDATYY
ncbi:peptidoglycan-binding protein [Streptomyces sp. JJ38]|nr:peptidoglycan-binding protein [Streptomyces sp. JJ38]